jgi:spore coat protein CotF
MINNAWDDKIILQDCLTSLKDTASLYNMSAIESANKTLKGEFLTLHKKVQDNITQVFDEMSKKGWYPVTPSDAKSINEVKTTVDTIHSSPSWNM